MKKASFIYPTYKTPTCRVTVKKYFDDNGKCLRDKMESIKARHYEDASIDDGRGAYRTRERHHARPYMWFIPKDDDWED